jgi:uncharacterized protein
MTVVDADIHNELASIDELVPYLSPHWAEQLANTRFKGPTGTDSPYPPKSDLAVSPELRRTGRPRDLDLVREVVLGAGVDVGILLCTFAVDSLHNPDQAVALARAVNDWQIAEWFAPEPRLRGSIVVPSQIPELAAEEINRVGDHPGFVQVGLPVRSQHPYGSRLFRPMWQAIAEHDLVAGLYFGGAPGNPPTPVGWPSYFIEEYVDMAGVFAAQITSIVVEGVFNRDPSLRVTLLESGATWLPAYLWRFDKEWKNLRRQIPWVSKPPSEYVHEHVRVTVEPWDLPPDDERLAEILAHFESDEILLDASGFPHQQVGQRAHLLQNLEGAALSRVKGDNAASWYRIANPESES